MKLSADTLKFIEEHESENTAELALQASKYPEIDIPLAIQQIAGRQVAKIKYPSWYQHQDILYPQHLSLEQSSSQETAQFKASLVEGYSMVDVTGGLGVDFSFLARNFKHATYVEQQNELVRLAKSNFAVLGLKQVEIVEADAIEYLQDMEAVDVIYIDPARRNDIGRKTVRIEDCTPNLVDIETLLEQKAKYSLIKLSPMLDISLAINTLRCISDIYILSVQNEVKELLLCKKKLTNASPTLHCINIRKTDTQKFSFTLEAEKNLYLNYTSTIEQYIYEPNSSILKAGAYKSVAKYYNISKLHASSHLYTSDVYIADFQGRKFEVQAISSFSKQDLKQKLSSVYQANITTRNFPLSVAELRKRLKLKEGGDVYILATTLANEQKVLILCKRL